MRSGVFLEPKKKLGNTSASQSAVHLTDIMGWEEACTDSSSVKRVNHKLSFPINKWTKAHS